MPNKDFTERYNTDLDEKSEQSFQRWIKGQTASLGRDVSRDLRDYDLRGWWQQQQRYDYQAKQNPEADPPVSFMRAGVYVPTGDLSSAPSGNIEDRTGQSGPVSNKSVPPRDPAMATSKLAEALGIGDIRTGKPNGR